jgi:hypothetical protein
MTLVSRFFGSTIARIHVNQLTGSPVTVTIASQLIDSTVTNATGESTFWLTGDSENLPDHQCSDNVTKVSDSLISPDQSSLTLRKKKSEINQKGC